MRRERWGRGGRKNKRGEIRYRNGGVYLSGVMSLAHTDQSRTEVLVSVEGTTTPRRRQEGNEIGGTKIAVRLLLFIVNHRISGACV